MEKDYREWYEVGEQIVFELIKEKPEGFCSDDFRDKAKLHLMPPSLLKTLSGNIIKGFAKANYIEKVGFKLSDNGNSSPIAVWKPVPAKVRDIKKGKI